MEVVKNGGWKNSQTHVVAKYNKDFFTKIMRENIFEDKEFFDTLDIREIARIFEDFVKDGLEYDVEYESSNYSPFIEELLALDDVDFKQIAEEIYEDLEETHKKFNQ